MKNNNVVNDETKMAVDPKPVEFEIVYYNR